MKIIIFGSTGMLGNYVKTIFLKNNYNIVCIKRNDFDILKDNWSKLYYNLEKYEENDVIINCAGIIPQKTENNDYKSYICINTLFPHKLQEICEIKKMKLIHITTDCVFDGKKGNYSENDLHTETNIYGISKSLGEPENCTIIRTSIIGEEIDGKKSLLEWVKSKKNEEINGYSNHFWNGVTCLTLSEIIEKIIRENIYWKGIKHIFSPNKVSKYELCCIINDIYKLDINIEATETVEICNKSLTSIFENIFDIKDIKTQIKTQCSIH